MLNRLLAQYESGLNKDQFAYRRDRGAGIHLLDFADFVRESRDDGRYAYAASIDVASAFDAVLHGTLMQTIREWQVDPFLARYIGTW